jgi:hypothetical protein
MPATAGGGTVRRFTCSLHLRPSIDTFFVGSVSILALRLCEYLVDES